jgi:hypothetical protein
MKIGIELEVLGNRRAALQAIRAAGVDCRDSGYTHATTQHWKIVDDGSIGARGFEVVSPVLESSNEQQMGDVRKVCDALVAAQCTVDRSCGFHVHVDASGISQPGFKTLVKVFAKFEPVMDSFMPASRRNNTYCRSLLQVVGVTQAPTGENLPVLLQQFFQRVDRCTDLRELHRLLMGTRYLKLNLESFWRHGTVEFRQHSGTTDAAKVLNWIEFCTGMVERCMREHTRVTLDGAGSLDTLFKAVRRPGLKRFYRMRAEILNGTRPDRRNALENAA